MAKPPPTQPAPAAVRPDHHGPAVDRPDAKPKRRWRRRLLRFVLLVVVLIAILIATGPLLLSTGPGTRALLWAVNKRIDGTVSAQDLSLAWFSGLSADGVSYTSSDAMHVVTAGRIDAPSVTLWGLVRGNRKFGVVSVRDLHGVTTEHPPGASSTYEDKIDTSGPGDDAPGRWAWAEGLSFELAVEGLSWRYRAAEIEPVDVVSSRLSLDVPGDGLVTLTSEGAVTQAGESGRFVIDITADGVLDTYGNLEVMQAAYAVDVSLQQVPVDAISRFIAGRRYANATLGYVLGTPERVSAMLGGRWLSLDIDAQGQLNQINATFGVHSDLLKTNLVLIRDEQGLSASSDSKLDWTLTPEALAVLFPKTTLSMQGPVTFTSQQPELVMPRLGAGFDWENVQLRAVLNAEDWELLDANGQVIALRGLRVGVGTEALGTEVTAVIESPVTVTAADGLRSVEQVFDASFKLTDALGDQFALEMRSRKVPIELADALFGYDGVMVMWLGEALDLDAVVRLERVAEPLGPTRMQYVYGLSSSSDRLGGHVDGMYRGRQVTMRTPYNESISAELSPELFAWLMGLASGSSQEPALLIDEPMPVFITVNRASLTSAQPRPGRASDFFDARGTYLDAEVELSSATVLDPRRGYLYELRSGTLTITPRREPGQFDVLADLELWVPPDAGEAGMMAMMRMEVNAFDVADARGGIPRSRAQLLETYGADALVRLENAPSALVDSLLGGDGGLAAALGPIVQGMDLDVTMRNGQARAATMRLNWDDATDAPIEGAHASMRPVEIAIDDAGVMRIADGQDVELQLRVTEDLGDHWLGQLHPVLFDAKTADRPVRVVIDGASFRYPLDGRGMQGANIDAIIDLGAVQFGQDSLLSHIVDWSGHEGERAVFDPTRVTIRDGLVSYSELALSVGNVRLQFDGAIDLVEQSVSEMAIRVPAESMVKVFPELDGVIELDDELVIPMTGPIRRPVVETQEFRAELVRLLARRPRARVEREAERIIDQVRDAVGDEAGEQGAQVVEDALRMLLGGGGE